MKSVFSIFVAVLFFSISGCVTEKVKPNENFAGKNVTVTMQAKSKSKVKGSVTIKEEPARATFVIQITGLPKNSVHGFHIHENGDCSAADAASAGGHFNPTGHEHGSNTGAQRHMGDLGNLASNSEGEAFKEIVIDGIDFQGKNTIAGRSLVIHAQPDDFKTQPSGNSGARIACGVIKF